MLLNQVTQIAVNGRPAIHHCPTGNYAKHLLPGNLYFHGGSWISGSAGTKQSVLHVLSYINVLYGMLLATLTCL